jgi:2-polyprenyl-6-methoxyphenol hydroxylase-like FAD-dependent oxidoreductase
VQQRDPVIIVGGGIGGLALAAACERVGLAYQVIERAPELREVGAGVGLWASAIRALTTIGVDTSRFPAAAELATAEICSWRGAVLSRVDVSEEARALGGRSLVAHRGELLTAIAERVDPQRVRLAAPVVAVREEGDAVVAELAGGELVRGRLLVGADGLRSTVRATLWGAAPPVYGGETCYRAVTDMAPPSLRTIREIQGPGQRAAVCVLGERRTYWWATKVAPEGEVDRPLERRAELLERFRGWPFGVEEAIAATDPAAILRNDLYDRPPLANWSAGRMTLLGDAAHPTTPNLGQGACMAIEDAVVLARMLKLHGDHARAFAAYEAERHARTAGIVALSRRFGAVGQWRNPLLVRVREALVRLTPKSVLLRTLREQIGYDAGPLPAG